jgi:hypothetical protein
MHVGRTYVGGQLGGLFVWVCKCSGWKTMIVVCTYVCSICTAGNGITDSRIKHPTLYLQMNILKPLMCFMVPGSYKKVKCYP